MSQIPLSFPAFYQCAIEGHSSLFKYDSVSVLLLGKQKSQLEPMEQLSGSEITNYSSGKKRIKDTLMNQLLSLTTEEAERRIQLLGIQDIGMVAYSLKLLIEKAELEPDIRMKISEAYRNGFHSFVAEVFLASIKYPPKNVRMLTQEEKETIAACWEYPDDHKELPSENQTESTAEFHPKKETNGHKMSQEEIEMLLDGMGFAPEPCKEYLLERDTANVLYVGSLRRSGINEAINILLSCGITSFSNIFATKMYAGLPHFDFYEDQSLINRLLFNNVSQITIIHRFTHITSSSLGSIEGYIAVSMDYEFFMDYRVKHVKECSVQFSSTREEEEYKRSISDELGNIFASSAVTALSELTAEEIFMIETASMLSIEKDIERDFPMFVGSLPFRSATQHFDSYLLLDWKSAHVLMDKMEQFVVDF